VTKEGRQHGEALLDFRQRGGARGRSRLRRQRLVAGVPSASNPAGSSTAAYEDGATLKVTIPGLVSPANNATTDQVGAPLVVTASTGKFAPVSGIVHRFEVVDPPIASWRAGGQWNELLARGLQPNTNYRWRARGEAGSAAGPWSSTGRSGHPTSLRATSGAPRCTTR